MSENEENENQSPPKTSHPMDIIGRDPVKQEIEITSSKVTRITLPVGTIYEKEDEIIKLKQT